MMVQVYMVRHLSNTAIRCWY